MTKVGVAGFVLALTMEIGTSARLRVCPATTNLEETAAHKILNRPTDGDATDPESHNEAVFGRQLVADLQVYIGHLASEDCFEPCIRKESRAADMPTL